MPESNNGPESAAPDNAATNASDPMDGFAEAMVGFGTPRAAPGQPAEDAAVETSGGATETKADGDQPAGDKPADSPTPEVKPEPAQTVNFDGIPDNLKATWELLHKSGAKPDEIQKFREGLLFQSAWTKKTTALAREREAFAAQQAKDANDLAALRRIRDDDRLHRAFLKAAEMPAEEEAEVDTLDPRAAAKAMREIAERAVEAKLSDAQRQDLEKATAYDKARAALKATVHEAMAATGATPEQMKVYLDAEQAGLPEGVDPILAFRPEELQHRVSLRHKAAQAEAKAAALEAQLTQRTSKEARTAKQSMPPPRRVVSNGRMTELQQTEEDLGLDQDWSNVQGLGHRH